MGAKTTVLLYAPLLVGILFCGKGFAQDDIAGVQAVSKNAGGDPKKKYLLIGDSSGEEKKGLLLVLAGGDGSEEFAPFVKRIYQHGLPKGFLVAHLIAVQWTPGQEIVWPTKNLKVPKAKFATEDFIAAVRADVEKSIAIDGERVFLLAWSSSGPAAYATLLQKDCPVAGGIIAMSVFHQNRIDLKNAKGRSFYLYHSPDDKICPFRMAEQAQKAIDEASGRVTLATYNGGHGWREDPFGSINKGIAWLTEKKE